jgi:hypothetical protein
MAPTATQEGNGRLFHLGKKAKNEATAVPHAVTWKHKVTWKSGASAPRKALLKQRAFSPRGRLRREPPRRLFRDRIAQLHVSEVNSQSRHDRLSLESVLAFQRVSHLVPADVPIIPESRVEESEINEEIQSVLAALNPITQLAVASD